jgi:hypothetical protein
LIGGESATALGPRLLRASFVAASVRAFFRSLMGIAYRNRRLTERHDLQM